MRDLAMDPVCFVSYWHTALKLIFTMFASNQTCQDIIWIDSKINLLKSKTMALSINVESQYHLKTEL